MVTLSFGILVLISTYAKGIAPGCQNCGCSVNKECSTEYVRGYYVDEYCTSGCIVGIGGNKCYNKCPSDCVACVHHNYTRCLSCDERKYLSEIHRCVDCPNNCKTCTSATQCQECYSPYYNDGSKQDCSLSCPRNCLCEHLGVCSACKDFFYNVRNTCRNACPDTCKTCTDQSHCQSCKPSYSGNICCVKNGNCHKCSSSTSCKKCSDGYYGNQCGNICPTKCESIPCNRENGNCFSCQDGYYGEKCGKSCPKRCHLLQCENLSGVCLTCNVGVFGNYCTRNCSKTCLNNRCNKQTGHCSDGCIVGYTGVNCTEDNGQCFSCQDGYNGANSDKPCPKTCHKLQCEMNIGACLSCDIGMYSNYSTHNCSKTCFNSRCHKDNGHCSDGRVAGYTGPSCTERSVPRIGSEYTTLCPTMTELGTVIGIAAGILVIIATIVIIVTIIIVRKWKMGFLRKHQDPVIEASYVNTELQTTSVEEIGVTVNDNQIGQSEYEPLGERNNKQSDEYDQIKSVN